MPTSIKQSERQLNLLAALLKAREGLLWTDVAKIEGYREDAPERSRHKRFERDLAELQTAGLVIRREKLSSAAVRYILDRAACLMPALHLSPEQRLLLFRIGLAYMHEGTAGPFTAQLSSALLKLQAGAGREGLPAVVPQAFLKRSLNRRPAEHDRLVALGKSLLERRRVSFDYDARQGQSARRTVAPYALVTRRGGWYLLGLDLERHSVRTFRLSRMRGAVRLATPSLAAPEYEIPDSFDAESAFSSEAFGAGEDSFRDVRVRFDADVAFIVENDFEGIYEIKRHADGGATLCLPQAYPGELLRYLCEFSGHWQVLSPAGLRTFVIDRLKGALAGGRA